jgi:hypothetical protein
MPMYFIALHNVLNVACTDCMSHPGLEVLVSEQLIQVLPNPLPLPHNEHSVRHLNFIVWVSLLSARSKITIVVHLVC